MEEAEECAPTAIHSFLKEQTETAKKRNCPRVHWDMFDVWSVLCFPLELRSSPSCMCIPPNCRIISSCPPCAWITLLNTSYTVHYLSSRDENSIELPCSSMCATQLSEILSSAHCVSALCPIGSQLCVPYTWSLHRVWNNAVEIIYWNLACCFYINQRTDTFRRSNITNVKETWEVEYTAC